MTDDPRLLPTDQMGPKTLEALQGSITKWADIVAGEGWDDGSDNCALCERFIDNDCVGCPVATATGKKGCQGSPYFDWKDFMNSNGRDFPDWTVFNDESRALAQAELDFLKSLLPKEPV